MIQLSAWINTRGLSIWFHSFILSLFQPPIPFCPPLLICFFFYPISLSQSLFVSQTPFLLVHTFLPHLLSISPPVHFLSPALNSFILSILASFLILPIWFSLFAGTTPLSHLPPFLAHFHSSLLLSTSLSRFTMCTSLFCHPTIHFFIPSFVNSLLSKFDFLKQNKPQVEFKKIEKTFF